MVQVLALRGNRSQSSRLTDYGETLDLPVATEIDASVLIGVRGLIVRVAVLVNGELETAPVHAFRAHRVRNAVDI